MDTINNEWTITIKCLDKSVYTVLLTNGGDSTILDVKNEASKLKNCDPTVCKLVHNGIILDNNEKKLSEYNIKNGFTIILLVQKKAKPTIEVKQPEIKVDTPEASDTEDINAEDTNTEDTNTEDTNTEENENDYGENDGDMGQGIQINAEEFLNLMMANPTINEFATNNPQEFMQILENPEFMENIGNNYGGNPNNAGRNNLVAHVELSEEDQQNVREIMELSLVSFEETVQYYMALDKDKEATINMIFNDRM